MFSSVMLGLNALMSITGVASGMRYNTTDNDLDKVASFICSKRMSSNRSFNELFDVEYYRDLYTLDGENRYIEVSLDEGYVIYDKKEQEIDEYSFSKQSPYRRYKETFDIYNEITNGNKHIVYHNDDFIDISNRNTKIRFESIIPQLHSSESKEAGKYYYDISITSSATVIPNAFYFQNLGKYHAFNADGTCAIVATEILLGYYDTFVNDTIVSEVYDVNSNQITTTNPLITDFKQSPGVDNYPSDIEKFHDYLCDIAKNEIGDDPIGGMATESQIKLVNKYLKEKNIDYSIKTSVGNLGDMISDRAVIVIKEAIDAGRPVIANGCGHSTVAFAYDEEYVWVHTGWGRVAATPWKTYYRTINLEKAPGAIDITAINERVHSNNYYSTNLNAYFCPCGERFIMTELSPDMYGFDPQYYFYNIEQEVVLDTLTFNTKRLRTGYIENEYINLSPFRQNAGRASLELYFSNYIRKFNMEISYWQILDKLNPEESSAYLEVLNKNNEWVRVTDLLRDIELSTDRKNQNLLSYAFDDDIKGIRFLVHSPSYGDRNLGRISIGKIYLIHTESCF